MKNYKSTNGKQMVQYTIPVVFHIIHTGTAPGASVNISQAQITDQLNILNNDFKSLYDFLSIYPLNKKTLNFINTFVFNASQLLDIDEILKTIAIYRIINKNKNIRIAAGRETRLKDFMGMAFMAGANGMLVGGYLTTKGRSLEDDVKFADDITKLWEQCID